MILTALDRRRHRRMAAERGVLTESDFISRLVASGIREDTAKFVWDEAAVYYFEPLKPDPGDRWEGLMKIDPEDLEDVTAKFWKQQGWAEPSPKDPVILPSDPTLLEYAQWLDAQRQLHQ
jgi:hypothetical protein